jgi:UDP-3-O-[3-hydroxymyristoyl] glucosamine N-acyltransferase
MNLIEKYNIPLNYQLSVLKKASFQHITYYTGSNLESVKHLKNCVLICDKELNFDLSEDVQIIEVDEPQLFFYQLSDYYKKDYLDRKNLIFIEEYKSYIHRNAKISDNVIINPGCVIGNSTIEEDAVIHSNVVIYSESIIGKGSIIESNSVIGAEGVMWAWNKDEKVKLHQLGNVEIQENVFIGSNVTIVRGSANESTIIGSGTQIAHGSQIGHGCQIGKNCHFGNNVSFAGSVITADNCFFGSGSVASSQTQINQPIILGANSFIAHVIEESGVYLGSPAKKVKEIEQRHQGVPLNKNIKN